MAFLKKVPPFQFLDDPPLRELARAIELDYYPTGTVILEQGGPPSEHLLVIKKGGAKVFVAPLLAVFLGARLGLETVTRRTVLGAIVTIAGILVLFSR